MTTHRITNAHNQLVGYIEERRMARRLELLDATRRRLGSYSPESSSTFDADGVVIGSGNKLLSLIGTADSRLRVEPDGET